MKDGSRDHLAIPPHGIPIGTDVGRRPSAAIRERVSAIVMRDGSVFILETQQEQASVCSCFSLPTNYQHLHLTRKDTTIGEFRDSI